MTAFIFANNVKTTLSAAITSTTQTNISLSSSANLPTLAAGQIMPITLNDALTGNIYEICYATAITGVTLTVLRGQEGTSALATWLIGDYAFGGPTAGTVAAVNGNVLQSMTGAQASAGNQFTTATQVQSGSLEYAIDTGTANNYVISITPAITALTDGEVFRFRAANASTGPCNLNVNGLGAKNLQMSGGIALISGQIKANGIYEAVYNSIVNIFELLDGVGIGSAGLMNASSNTGIVSAVSGAVVVGNLPQFSDTAGTITEGPAQSSITGTVAAVNKGAGLTIGHLAIFNDTLGTVTDGGLPGVANTLTYLDFATNAGATLGPGSFAVDTTGGAFTVYLPLTPVLGNVLMFMDIMNYWGTNNFTVSGNGNNIGNVATNVSATFLANVSDYQFSVEWTGTYWRLI